MKLKSITKIVALTNESLIKVGWNPKEKNDIDISIHEREGYISYILYSRNLNPLSLVIGVISHSLFSKIKTDIFMKARSLNVSLLFITDGETIFLINIIEDDSRIVQTLFSQEELERKLEISHNLTLDSSLSSNVKLRIFQIEAIINAEKAIKEGRRDLIIQMPAGTGRVYLMTQMLSRLFEIGLVKKVLIVANFLTEAHQIQSRLTEVFPPEIINFVTSISNIPSKYKITITTYQSLVRKYQSLSCSYYDAVLQIDQKASRMNRNEKVFEYFDSLKINFTNELSVKTESIYKYSFESAIKDGILASLEYINCNVNELFFKEKDLLNINDVEEFGSTINFEIIKKMVNHFDELINKENKNISMNNMIFEKSIIYTSSKFYASLVTDLLNLLHPNTIHNYAEVIITDQTSADINETLERFRNSEFPKILVNVNMLEYGVEFTNIVNIALFKKVRNSQQLAQIISNGARKSTVFLKDSFFVYDFFNNEKFLRNLNNEQDQKSNKSHQKQFIQSTIRNKPPIAIEIGFSGESIRIQEYIRVWEDTVNLMAKKDPLFLKLKSRELLTPEEELVITNKLNEHKYYFNEENLKKAYNISYMSLIDFILLPLGLVKPKKMEEIFHDEYILWKSGKHFNNSKGIYADVLRNICLKKKGVVYIELAGSLNNIKVLGEIIFGVRDLKDTIKEINNIFETTMLQDKSSEII